MSKRTHSVLIVPMRLSWAVSGVHLALCISIESGWVESGEAWGRGPKTAKRSSYRDLRIEDSGEGRDDVRLPLQAVPGMRYGDQVIRVGEVADLSANRLLVCV